MFVTFVKRQLVRLHTRNTHDGIKMKDLADKTVLVTGASSGIGRAIALAFGSRGARVGVHYRSGRKEADAVAETISKVGAAETFHADMSSTREVDALADAVLAAFGHVDVVVNSVGGFVERTTLAEADDKLVDAVFDLNARSMMTLNRHMIASFRSNGTGCIINLTSQAARTGASAGAGLYASTKAYVSTYTRALAKELASEGIRVNAIAPGVIDTPFHHGQTSPELLRQLASAIPMGRLGTAEECAGTALFLASEEESGYITGQVIEVNGGYLMP